MNLRIPAACALSLTLAACATSGGYSHRSYPNDDVTREAEDRYARCNDCGVVERIERIQGQRSTTGTGAVLGGIVGGVLGNQVGSGDGRTAATVAGAVAGGIAGNEIERSNNAAPSYEVHVRMDDGRRIVVGQRDLSGVREGAYVIVSGGRARLR